MNKEYRALRVHEVSNGVFERRIETCNISDLPDHEVLVRVKYAGMNYKDALSAYGNRGVTRRYPHTPGIDASGIVEESSSNLFKKGDRVVAGGDDMGMNTPGGFGEYIRVPAKWLFKLPDSVDLRYSSLLGGTGFTAGLSIMTLMDQGVKPEDGPVLVTGAAGGVGSWAVLILKKLGFKVIAGTSNIDDSDEFIHKLGADEHVDKSVIDDTSGKPLLKWKWAGVIENVGGNVLATALKACKPGGTVTCCGNIYSHELNTTVYPFILNGIKLIGISSPDVDFKTKARLWGKFLNEYKVDIPDIVTEVDLDGLPKILETVIGKKNRGQVLLKHS